MFGRGGRAVNKFRDECFPHVCTWSDMYNFLEDFLWVAAPSQSQFWGYVKSLVWHPMSCCDTEMKHTICLCFFTRNTVILPHVLHSFNLTILKPKLWKYHTFCTISKPKLWYYHAFYRVSKPKLWYLHILYIFHTVWSQNCDMSSCLALLPHVLRSLKPKTAIWPHVLHSFRGKTVILPPVFHSLEIKPMMFLHLLRSFGSKIAKLPHVLTFFFNFT